LYNSWVLLLKLFLKFVDACARQHYRSHTCWTLECQVSSQNMCCGLFILPYFNCPSPLKVFPSLSSVSQSRMIFVIHILINGQWPLETPFGFKVFFKVTKGVSIQGYSTLQSKVDSFCHMLSRQWRLPSRKTFWHIHIALDHRSWLLGFLT
jgi:hypothetical protein